MTWSTQPPRKVLPYRRRSAPKLSTISTSSELRRTCTPWRATTAGSSRLTTAASFWVLIWLSSGLPPSKLRLIELPLAELVERIVSSRSSPLSCFSRMAVTPCSTTSGLAPGYAARTVTRLGAIGGRFSTCRAGRATRPANSTSRLHTRVNTGRFRNGSEIDRKTWRFRSRAGPRGDGHRAAGWPPGWHRVCLSVAAPG